LSLIFGGSGAASASFVAVVRVHAQTPSARASGNVGKQSAFQNRRQWQAAALDSYEGQA